MTLSRRTALVSGVTGIAALTAGCLDFITGDEALDFEAEQAAPSESTVEETGFEEREILQETIEEEVEAGGVEREVSATFWVSSYTKEVEVMGDSEDAIAFAAVSTPDVSVAGQSFNPIDDMDNEELIEEFADEMQSEQADIEDVEQRESISVSILGESRPVDILEGVTSFRGEEIDVEILMTSFEHEDDYLVLVGTYPEIFADEQREDIESLLESVDHPV